MDCENSFTLDSLVVDKTSMGYISLRLRVANKRAYLSVFLTKNFITLHIYFNPKI